MYIIPFLHFFSFAVYIALAVFVWLRNRTAPLNKAGMLLLGLFAVWSLGAGFAQSPFISKQTAKVWYTIGSIGWTGFGPAFVCFALILIEKSAVLTRKAVAATLIVLPLLFIYQQWNGNLLADYIREPYGWSHTWSNSLWAYAFYAYYLGAMAFTTGVLWVFMRRTAVPVKKKQARILIITGALAVVIGSLSNVVQQRLGIHTLPPMADVAGGLTWAAGLTYVMVRYRFFAISAATAAEHILSTMKDILILVDAEGRIVVTNQAVRDLLGYSEREMAGMPVNRICPGGADMFRRIVHEGAPYATHEEGMTARDGHIVSVLISTSLLRDDAGSAIGAVCVGSDITVLKKTEATLTLTLSRWQTTIDALTDSFMFIDLDGVILQCNKATEAILKLPAAEIIGRKCWELMHGTQTPITDCPAIRMRQSGKRESTTLFADGRWYEVIVDPASDAAGTLVGAVHIITDITDRKRSADRLEKINDYFTHLGSDPDENIRNLTGLFGELMGAVFALYRRLDQGQLCSMGVWHLPSDFLLVGKPEGCISYDLMRNGSGEILVIRDLPQSPYALTDPMVAKYGLKTYVGIPVKAGAEFAGALCALYQDDHIPGEADRKVIEIIAAAIAIEEMRKIDIAALVKEGTRAQQYLDVANVMFVALDTAGTVTMINQKGCQILGWPIGDIIGKNWFEHFLPAHSRESVRQTFARLMAGELATTEYAENVIVTRDGIERVIAWHNAVMRDRGHAIIGTLASGEDITDRKKMEAELARRLKDLEHFNKFAVGRELKMMELKKRIAELETRQKES